MSLYASCANIGKAKAAAVALLVVHIAEGRLPTAVGKADGMPDDAIPIDGSNMQITTYACTTNIGEAEATAVALLVVHIAKVGLPTAVGKADGMPDRAIRGKTNDLQVATHIGTSNIGKTEATAVALLVVHIAKVGLPTAVGKADGMPDRAIRGDGSDMQITTYACTIQISEAEATAVALLVVHIAKVGLPTAVGKADGMPDRAIRGKTNDLQVATHIGTSNIGKTEATAVALLVVHIAKVGLPTAVGKADGMPDRAIRGDGSDMQITTYACTIQISEAEATAVALLVVHIAKVGLPTAVGKADGMPDRAIRGKTNDLQVATHIGTSNIGKTEATALP